MEKQIKEAYNYRESAFEVMSDGSKVMAIGDMRSTRNYHYEDVEFEWKNGRGMGTYRWLNRPWQRFDYASALIEAMKNAGVEDKFARQCVNGSYSLKGAIEYFAKNYKEAETEAPAEEPVQEACTTNEEKLVEEPTYDLSPRYDSRQSFYGKARVKVDEPDTENKLYSYGTLVAELKDGKPVVYGTYSATTLRHIKEWLKQLGFKADSLAQIRKDYMGESLEEEPKKELTEAPDQMGFATDDELEAEERAEFEKRLAARKAQRDTAKTAEIERQEKEKAKAERKAELKAQFAGLIEEGKPENFNNTDDLIQFWFDKLVPDSGKAETLAGELIRAINRIIYRDFNDGDVFYEGYGLTDTCGQPVTFIVEAMNDFGDNESADNFEEMFEDIADRVLVDKAYTKAIEDIGVEIIKWIIANPESLAETDHKDMWEVGVADWLEDASPKYELEISYPDNVQELLDNDFIDTDTIDDQISEWEMFYYDSSRVSCDNYEVYFSELKREEYDELEENAYNWLEQWGEEKQKEIEANLESTLADVVTSIITDLNSIKSGIKLSDVEVNYVSIDSSDCEFTVDYETEEGDGSLDVECDLEFSDGDIEQSDNEDVIIEAIEEELFNELDWFEGYDAYRELEDEEEEVEDEEEVEESLKKDIAKTKRVKHEDLEQEPTEQFYCVADKSNPAGLITSKDGKWVTVNNPDELELGVDKFSVTPEGKQDAEDRIIDIMHYSRPRAKKSAEQFKKLVVVKWDGKKAVIVK